MNWFREFEFRDSSAEPICSWIEIARKAYWGILSSNLSHGKNIIQPHFPTWALETLAVSSPCVSSMVWFWNFRYCFSIFIHCKFYPCNFELESCLFLASFHWTWNSYWGWVEKRSFEVNLFRYHALVVWQQLSMWLWTTIKLSSYMLVMQIHAVQSRRL